ncbi:Fatty acyl-CoA reductase [Pirellulimonas nuda]|uniref:Fatty acyl-CoA reductase n=1 Tax=Pirellulimonas nuda TaxID=2528009 RepID=A0A518D9L8_9BACT|nr:SDR family oxidoreductase [Pirellulimonas nuda]QDU88174.1 Fatty acyl-CoA reductase [Pirellulimonas nuda]
MPEVTLITGASSGIGLELAKLFAADGANLVLVARSEGKLHDLAGQLHAEHGVESLVVPADLADAAAPRSIFDRVAAARWQVDVLVNNAGFGEHGYFEQVPLERQMNMVQVNVASLVRLTHLLLPGMVQRGRGGVLNVGSTASFVPGPTMSIYYASKAFVRSFTEALHEELRGQPLKISCLCPGPTDTGFVKEASLEGSTIAATAVPVEGVARAGYRGFRNNKAVVVPGLSNKLMAFAVRFAPRWLVRRIVTAIQPLPPRG